MTKQEIIDALCQCAESARDCTGCPYDGRSRCFAALIRDAAQALKLTLCDKAQDLEDSETKQE